MNTERTERIKSKQPALAEYHICSRPCVHVNCQNSQVGSRPSQTVEETWSWEKMPEGVSS